MGRKSIVYDKWDKITVSKNERKYMFVNEDFHKKAEDYDELMRSALVTNNMEFLSYI